MYGPNEGLEIGKRALLSQQLSLNLTGHNIANANTPGFTRQQAILGTTSPLNLAFGSVGTGVDIDDIRRLRSIFLDRQYRSETEAMGKWDFLSRTWSQIEAIYCEPDESALSGLLDNFWNSWQDLSSNPESEAARVAVREQGLLLTNSFHHVAHQLSTLRDSLDRDISKMVHEINELATQIADLNQCIVSAELTGGSANDLRDRRDALVDQLSEWANVSVSEEEKGVYSVYLGSMALVEGNSKLTLMAEVDNSYSQVIHEVYFKETGNELKAIGGQLGGLLEARDHVVVERLKELDDLAEALVTAVNEQHRSGYGLEGSTGLDFFRSEGISALSIELDGMILSDPNNIAASASGEIGDNANALSIASLKDALKMRDGQSSFNEYYNGLIGEIGIRSREAQNIKKNQETLVAQLDNFRQSLHGVSLDEEMANMIKYQHAYEAAARVISTMDSVMDTLINRMGMAS